MGSISGAKVKRYALGEARVRVVYFSLVCSVLLASCGVS